MIRRAWSALDPLERAAIVLFEIAFAVKVAVLAYLFLG